MANHRRAQDPQKGDAFVTNCARIGGICLVMGLLGACVNLTKSYPEKHYYVLEVARQGNAFASDSMMTLRIRKFRAAPSFEGKEFVYRTGDGQYEADFYNEWFVSPNGMLTHQVQSWLTRSGRFHNVTDGSGPSKTSQILEATVTALYGDYRVHPPRAVLGLDFFLVGEAPDSAEIMWHREYREEVPLTKESPDALVIGWTAALREVLVSLENDLSKHAQR